MPPKVTNFEEPYPTLRWTKYRWPVRRIEEMATCVQADILLSSGKWATITNARDVDHYVISGDSSMAKVIGKVESR